VKSGALSIVLFALLVSLVTVPQVGSAQTPTATQPAGPAGPAALPGAARFGQPDADDAPADPAADDGNVRRGDEDDHDFGGPHFWDGGNNVVQIQNYQDGRMRVRGRTRLVHAHGESVAPVNAAYALASCTDCQTFAVALEIVLVSPNTTDARPENHAIARNVDCTRCATVARALQYVVTVDDPEQVPDNIQRLLGSMEREIEAVGRERNIDANTANARINAVIAQFQELGSGLTDQQDQTDEPDSPGTTPAAAPAASPAASPAADAATATLTATPEETAPVGADATATPTATTTP
jgi:putative peptide zinc metalloprotease protein